MESNIDEMMQMPGTWFLLWTTLILPFETLLEYSPEISGHRKLLILFRTHDKTNVHYTWNFAVLTDLRVAELTDERKEFRFMQEKQSKNI